MYVYLYTYILIHICIMYIIHIHIRVYMYVEREKVHSFPLFSLYLCIAIRYPRICVYCLASYLKIWKHWSSSKPYAFPTIKNSAPSLMHFFVLSLVCISATYSFQFNDYLLALIVFKSDLIDPKNALKSWNEDDNSPCNWEGIVCNAENGRVITLNLNGLSLSLHIRRTLVKLEFIETISLSNNCKFLRKTKLLCIKTP